MKKTDINKIEKILNLKLPKYYVKALLNYDETKENHDFDLYFFNDAQILIEENELMREPTFSGIDWDSDILVIGNNYCGTYYCIDVNSNYQTVFSYSRETKKLTKYYNSISEWYTDLQETHKQEQTDLSSREKNHESDLQEDIVDE